jgi:hypothetical protein
MILIMFFIILQLILLLFMLLHDWIKIPPLNDLDALCKEDSVGGIVFSTIVNVLFVAVPLFLTLQYFLKRQFHAEYY